MISSIKGTVRLVDKHGINIRVENTGLEFRVFMAQGHEFVAGSEANIETLLVWNQEQGPSLYGFLSGSQRETFDILLGCQGIGPKMALAILSELSLEQIVDAVIQHDGKALSKVSGIGPKKAEQLILQLHGKVEKLKQLPGLSMSSSTVHLNKAQEVLESLGYSRQEILLSMNFVRDQNKGKDSTLDEILRQCLAFLSGKR